MDRQADRQTIRQTDRQYDRQTDRQTNRQSDRQTNRQTIRQTDKQTDGQMDRQTTRLSVPTFPSMIQSVLSAVIHYPLPSPLQNTSTLYCTVILLHYIQICYTSIICRIVMSWTLKSNWTKIINNFTSWSTVNNLKSEIQLIDEIDKTINLQLPNDTHNKNRTIN